MIIDLPVHIENLIIAQAKSKQISVSDLIGNWAKQEQYQSNPMIEAVMSLPKSDSFDDYDMVALQRQWRDEWR